MCEKDCRIGNPMTLGWLWRHPLNDTGTSSLWKNRKPVVKILYLTARVVTTKQPWKCMRFSLSPTSATMCWRRQWTSNPQRAPEEGGNACNLHLMGHKVCVHSSVHLKADRRRHNIGGCWEQNWKTIVLFGVMFVVAVFVVVDLFQRHYLTLKPRAAR